MLLRQLLSRHKTGRPGGSAHPLCSAHRPSRPTRCACGGLDLAYPRRNEACDCDALERRKVVLRRGRLLFQQPLIEEPKRARQSEQLALPRSRGPRLAQTSRDKRRPLKLAQRPLRSHDMANLAAHERTLAASFSRAQFSPRRSQILAVCGDPGHGNFSPCDCDACGYRRVSRWTVVFDFGSTPTAPQL